MKLYRAVVQGDSKGLREVKVKADSRWAAIELLESRNLDVLDIYDAPIEDLIADAVLAKVGGEA